MKKYAQIQDVVCRLTEDKTFRTFFTIYLMAESDKERESLNDRFWGDAENLSLTEQQLLKAELTRCFLRLPGMTAELSERVIEPALLEMPYQMSYESLNFRRGIENTGIPSQTKANINFQETRFLY